MRRRLLARAGAAAIALTAVGLAPARAASPVRGIFNWIHGTGDAERAFAFYHDVFGIELARSPFAGGASAGAPPEPIRPAAQAGSDPLVWDLTNTHGSRFRTVFMRAPNTPFGLELSEFFDIARGDRAANPWDPGASTLIFSVRDLDAVAGRLKARGAPVVTLGGAALTTPSGRAVLVRDPDGCLIEVRQAPPAAVSQATAPGDVIETSIGITVASRERAREFYEKLLGFTVKGTRTASAAELRLHGLAGGTLTETAMSIPGTAVTIVLSEFTLPAGTQTGEALRLAASGRRLAAIPARGERPRRADRSHEASGLPVPQRRREAHSTGVRTVRVRDRS